MSFRRPTQGDYGRDGSSRNGGNNNFPNSGALFPVRDKRSDNSPDMTGNIILSDDVLDYIIREAEGGNEVQLDLSAWVRISRNNTSFTSVKINIPWSVRKEQEGNQTFRRPGYPNRGQQMDRDNRRAEPRETEPRTRRFDPDERNAYRDQSQGSTRQMSTQERRRMEDQDRNREFAKGDRLPNFLDDDDDDASPWSKDV